MRFGLMAFALSLSSSAAFGAIANFELPWFNGASGAVYKSADHPRSVFVLEAFQNFCPACNANAANVDALAASWAGNPKVQVLDLSLDSSDREVRSWIANHNPNHPVVKDVDRRIWSEIAEQYIPTAVVVDCQGSIVWRHTDVWDDATVSELNSAIRTALNSCR